MRLQDALGLFGRDLTSVEQRIEGICKCSAAIGAAESLTTFTRLSVFVDFWAIAEWAVHLCEPTSIHSTTHHTLPWFTTRLATSINIFVDRS